MKLGLKELSAALAAAAALNGCGPSQPAERPQASAYHSRSLLDRALSHAGGKEGIRQRSPDSIASVACAEGQSEDLIRDMAAEKAGNQMRAFACPSGNGYVPMINLSPYTVTDLSRTAVCHTVITPNRIVCDGKLVKLDASE